MYGISIPQLRAPTARLQWPEILRHYVAYASRYSTIGFYLTLTQYNYPRIYHF